MADATFWKQRWIDDQVGWHRNEINPTLKAHWSSLGLGSNSCVLVPLCGRTLDLKWIADQGQQVTGIELSEIAARGVFEDANLNPDENSGQLKADSITVRIGDIFALEGLENSFEAIWDRAALVAINPEDRQRYANLLINALVSDGQMLLNVFCYTPDDRGGPPFSIDLKETETLFGSQCNIDIIETVDVFDDSHRDRGYTACNEHIVRLRKK